MPSPQKPSSNDKEEGIYQLKNATMEDVVLSEKADNIIALNRKSQKTRLKEIKGIDITNIDLRAIRMFANQVGLKGQRKKMKADICSVIVDAVVSGEWRLLKETAKEEEKRKKMKKKNVTINWRRLLNVVSSDLV